MGGDGVEEVVEQWTELSEAIKKIHDILVEAFERVWEGICVFCEAFHGVLWQAYLVNGAPYGENDEGMWRWAHECVEVARLRAEAEKLEEHHKTLVGLRKMVKEKNDKSLS